MFTDRLGRSMSKLIAATNHKGGEGVILNQSVFLPPPFSLGRLLLLFFWKELPLWFFLYMQDEVRWLTENLSKCVFQGADEIAE